MKILIMTSEIGNQAGGLALTAERLRKQLEKLGHNVFVEVTLEKKGYQIIEGGYDPLLANKLKQSYHLDILQKKYQGEIDILISYGAAKTAYLTYLLAESLDKNFYVVLCGSEINLARGDLSTFLYNNIALPKANKIISLSKELIEHSRVYQQDLERYVLIPNSYPFEDKNYSLHKGRKLQKEERIIFGNGSTFLSEKKGISNLIKAFSIFIKKTKRKDLLYLYGKVDSDILQEYQKIIEAEGMEKQVQFLGYLNRKEYEKALDDIDVFLQTSPYEGCSNSTGEAILNKKYILISDTGYFAETLKSEYPKCIIPNLKKEEFANTLEEYIAYISKEDPREDIYTSLIEQMKEERVLEQWKEILEENKEENILSVMFHDVNNAFTGIDYPEHAFEELMFLVKQAGYYLTSYREYQKAKNKEKMIVCTFDDAYEYVYRHAFPIMKKYGFKGTVFVCPDYIGKTNSWNHRDEIVRKHMDLEMLLELEKENWEIGSHGMSHYNMIRLSQTELEESLEKSKKLLEEHFQKVISFCYPYGEFKPYIRNLVAQYYEVAFSVDMGGSLYPKDRYQLVRLVPEELKKMLRSK